MSYTDKFFKDKCKLIFLSIQNGFNSESEYRNKMILPNYDMQQLAQYFGNGTEAASRGELKKLGLNCRAGDPKNKNEDDVIILEHRTFDFEMKLTLRKYTKTGKLKKASWWTDRNQYDDKLRNFICIEAEYRDGVFKFIDIFVSFKKLSYMDIMSHTINRDLIAQNSINIWND